MEKEMLIYEALAKALNEMEQPKLNSTVKYGATNFRYADLGAVLAVARKPLLDNGFIIMHDVFEEDGIHWMKSYLAYKDGFTVGDVRFPVDIKGKKMQEIGSQITYLKRYSICILCGLVGEEDDDAVGIADKPLNTNIKTRIDGNRVKEIVAFVHNNVNAWDTVTKVFGFKAPKDITTDKFDEVKKHLKLLAAKEAFNENN